jgi:hypothetical protein
MQALCRFSFDMVFHVCLAPAIKLENASGSCCQTEYIVLMLLCWHTPHLCSFAG